MTVEKQLIDKVESIRTTLHEISVYNLDVKTSLELYYELAKKVNEVINELSRFEGIVSDEVVEQNKKLIYLLGEGLKEQVGLKIDELITNGTMDSIINHKIFNDLNTKIDTFKQEVNEQFNTIINSSDKLNIRLNNKKNFYKYELPSNFTKSSFPIEITTDGTSFKYTYDISKFKTIGGVTYFVSPTGSDANVGTEETNPTTLTNLFSRQTNALKNGDTIVLLDGVYRDIANISDNTKSTISNNINMIAKNKGKVIIANVGNKLTWSKYNENGVYSTGRSNCVKVAQVVEDIEFLTSELKKVTSLTECVNLEGSWYTDNTTLYVHTLFNVEPTFENLFPILKYDKPVINVDSNTQAVYLYLEGINFIGGNPSTVNFEISSNYNSSILYAKDCKFLHAYDNNLQYDAVSIKGARAYFVNCSAEYSSKDGFNYHAKYGIAPRFIEINCVGANNGLDGIAISKNATFQNGSTAHDGVYGLRINSKYYNNYGGNVADVHQNTTTVNINCIAFDSACKDDSMYNSDFSTQQEGATMILESCTSFGSKYSHYAVLDSTIESNNCVVENVKIEK